MRGRPRVPRLIQAALLSIVLAACGGTDGGVQIPVLLVPSAQAPTLAAAIALLARGGIIRLGAGDHVGNVVVDGERHIHLIGAAATGPGATRIVAFDGTLPVIVVQDRARLTGEDLCTLGGSAGIQGLADLIDCGSESLAERPGRVLLDHVVVEGAVRGIAGTFSALDLADVEVCRCTLHGLSVSPDSMTVSQGHFHGNAGVGLYVRNLCPFPPGEICLQGVQLEGNELGGLLVVGGASPVKLVQVTAGDNRIAGIRLEYVGSFSMSSCDTSDNRSDLGGFFGDGVLTISSNGTIQALTATLNERAGIAGFSNSLLALGGSLLVNPINLNNETGTTFMDDGGNCCDTPIPCGVCSAQSSDPLEPAPVMP